MESAIHDVHTALNRPGVTGTKSRRSAHCVDGDKDQTADAAKNGLRRTTGKAWRLNMRFCMDRPMFQN
jgi:hypothetical protein